MAVSLSTLLGQPQVSKSDLDSYLEGIRGTPGRQALAELTQLIDAGEARLPKGALKTIRDQIEKLSSDGFDQAPGGYKVPKAPLVTDARIERIRIMDSGSPRRTDPLTVTGTAVPGAQVEFFNASMPGRPGLGRVAAGADGAFAFTVDRSGNNYGFGDQIGARVLSDLGVMSDAVVVGAKTAELRTWASGKTESVDVGVQDARLPFVDGSRVTQTHTRATPSDAAQHLLLAGRAGATEAGAKLEVVLESGVMTAQAAADGSFLFDVKGVKPGTQVQLRVIDANGQVTTTAYNVPALPFDTAKLVRGSQGVPFDRVGSDGKADAKGPYLSFAAAGAVEPFTTVVVQNHTTGETFSAQADKTGALALELAGVHSGDSLSFFAKDAAGNPAPNALENWIVPAQGSANPRLSELVCANTLLKETTDELLALLKAEPTSVHRALVEDTLEHHRDRFRNPADADRVQKALDSLFAGAKDVRTNATNPAPKAPIVIGAKVIKPRVMDQGNVANRDPLEVSGRAEPYTTVEIRNASQPGAPVIGTVQADKNGEFAFRSTDERLFLHGDQLLVRARDQGGSTSADALAHTCAYELRVWNASGRTELVELPDSTDTRNPFLDQSKLEQGRLPIAADGGEQVHRIKGGPLAGEPNSVVRVTNRAGQVFETKVAQDGSFDLKVGKLTPGETLTANVFDVNGRAVAFNFATPALRFDPAALTSSTEGSPFHRYDREGKVDASGPFLAFAAAGTVDPFTKVTVRNNTTGESVTVQADERGDLAFTLKRVHAGDSLGFSATDPAGNAAPGALENYVVPGVPVIDRELVTIECQHLFLPEHTTRVIEIVSAAPTASHRGLVEHLINDRTTAFQDAKDLNRLKKLLQDKYSGEHDVRSYPTNPAPKDPIIVDANIIKPREMEPRPQPTPSRPSVPPPPRDPLEVTGRTEAFARIEIRNASQPGSPVIGTVTADRSGRFDFLSTDERLFLHGDQILVRAVDQGGATSGDSLETTCAFDLRVWYNPPRMERVLLPKTSDSRNPFLDMSRVTHAREPIAKDATTQIYTVKGAAGSGEPNSIVRVTTRKGETFEALVKKDGSFELKVGAFSPGETLNLTVFDINGRAVTSNVGTTPLRFDNTALLKSSEALPYHRYNASSAQAPGAAKVADENGPFLRFGGVLVDPWSLVTVKNVSTGQSLTVQADKDGKVDLELAGVHSGDVLAFSAADPCGNAAPSAITSWVVPAVGVADQRIKDILCQQTVLKEHVDVLLAVLREQPTATHRGLIEAFLAGKTDHPDALRSKVEKDRLQAALDTLFARNDVRSTSENPAPKEPIVVGARIIKPRVMDQGNTARDPLELSGKAEPLTTIEIRNASQPGSPVIGTVQTDAAGDFKFISTDERLFVHGDQLLVRATDSGGARSGAAVTGACAYELQVWNATGRTELVQLPHSTDTRNPFLDTSRVTNTQTLATAAKPQTFTTLSGAAGSSEPGAVVRVTTSKGRVCEAQVKPDGSFALNVGEYVPGETLTATVLDVHGRAITSNFATAALKFDTAKLTAGIWGPPYQKQNDGETVAGGPFLAFKADDVAFPGAKLTVTNHSTGKVYLLEADARGGFDFELAGVHAHDLLSFTVADAAGNAAPATLKAWSAPLTGPVDTTVCTLSNQRPMTDLHVRELLRALEAEPTVWHRQVVERLTREHPEWFQGEALKTLQKGVDKLFGGKTQRVPDSTNPRPQIPVVLTAEIVKPRVMDSGNAVRDPLYVTGLAEPLSWIDLYNGSVPGRPLIGKVQVGEDGKFRFESTDESKFVHGDQIVVQAADAGDARSDRVVSGAKAFELRIWNSNGRREKVGLGRESDARNSFLNLAAVKGERAGGDQASSGSLVIVGGEGSTEPFARVSVTIGANTFSAEAGVDGEFRLPAAGLPLGQPVALTITDANGRATAVSWTAAIA